MKWITLIKPVPELPYKPGDHVPVHQGPHGYVWHVWKCIVQIPADSFTEEEEPK